MAPHVLDVTLADEALLRHIEVLRQQRPDALHGLNGLCLRVSPILQLLDERVAVKVVHV